MLSDSLIEFINSSQLQEAASLPYYCKFHFSFPVRPDFHSLQQHHLSVTTILSASATVLILWAIIITVLSLIRRGSDSWIIVSLSASNDAVASSSNMIGAFFRNALAIEILCRSPPESSEPFSPIIVFHPSESFFRKFIAMCKFRCCNHFFICSIHLSDSDIFHNCIIE